MERVKDVGGTILAWIAAIVIGWIILLYLMSSGSSDTSHGGDPYDDRGQEYLSEKQEVGR